MKSKIILSIGFFSIAILAQKDRPCTVDGLTNTCRNFSNNSPAKIDLPDGTFIPNFSVLVSGGSKSRSETVETAKNQYNTSSFEYLKMQAQIMRLLEQVPSNLMNDEAKLFLSSRPDTFQDIFFDSKKEYTLPWPLSKPTGVTSVPADELKKIFIDRIPPDLKTKFETQAKQIDNFVAKQIEEYGVGQLAAARSLRSQMTTVSGNRINKVAELVESTRQSILKKIMAGRDYSQLGQHEKKAYDKIKTITSTPFHSQGFKTNPMCNGVIPNAYYSPSDHSINICPNFYNLPDLTILGAIGHEFGHAIDPCNCQFGHGEINQVKLGQELGKPEAKSDSQYIVLQGLKELTDSGITVTAYPFSLGLNKAQFNYLKSSNLIDWKSLETPFSQYPFKNVFDCLVSPKGGSFRRVTSDEIRTFATNTVDLRKQTGLPGYNGELDKKDIIDALTRHPECLAPNRNSQTGEAFSDWLGASVVGDFIEGKKMQSPSEKMSVISYFASVVCLQRAELVAHQSKNRDRSPVDVYTRAKQELEMTQGSHPQSQLRIENIFLREPRIREALGCGPATEKACEHIPVAKQEGGAGSFDRIKNGETAK